MEQKEFTFDEATPLQAFINKYRDRIVGHVIKACYTEMGMYVRNDNGSQPVFLILDDLVIGIEYLYRGHVTIFTADESDFELEEHDDDSGRKDFVFHSRIPGRDDAWGAWYPDMPAMGQKIKKVKIGRHSDRYEDYPNSERPEGGDYFSWIEIRLEDGSVLHIYAEDAISDGYVDVWLSDLPAYSLIKTEIDRDPSELGMRIHHEFNDVMWACEPKPNELAELAMQYMRKCDHEIERNLEAYGDRRPHGYHTVYTDFLHDVVGAFIGRGMNIKYTDASGEKLLDLAVEIGDEAGSRVLPLLYTPKDTLQYLEFFDRRVSHELTLLSSSTWKNLKNVYDSLPEDVKATPYGQKMKGIKQDGLRELEAHITAIRDFVRPLH